MQQVTVTLRFNTPFKMEGTDEQIARWVFSWAEANEEKSLSKYIESWTVENSEK